MKETIETPKEIENERTLSPWITFSAFFVLMLFLNFITMGIFLATGLMEDPKNSSEKSDVLMTAAMLVNTFISSIICLRIEGKPFSDLGLAFKGRIKDLFIGLIISVLIYALGFAILLLTGSIEVSGWSFSPTVLVYSWFFFLLVSFNEEIMVRGFVLGRLLNTRMNRFVALCISSIIFSLLHIFNPGISVLSMINLFLAGLLLGIPFIYTRNLALPISLHLFWNWIQGPVLGFKVSGNNLSSSLLEINLPKDNLLNGGAFGFEGSMVCAILQVLFITILIFWGEKKKLS